MGRYNLDKPNPLWKHYSKKYVDNDSVKMILSLHKIEKQLRKEIAETQVTYWSKERIRKVYG